MRDATYRYKRIALVKGVDYHAHNKVEQAWPFVCQFCGCDPCICDADIPF